MAQQPYASWILARWELEGLYPRISIIVLKDTADLFWELVSENRNRSLHHRPLHGSRVSEEHAVAPKCMQKDYRLEEQTSKWKLVLKL